MRIVIDLETHFIADSVLIYLEESDSGSKMELLKFTGSQQTTIEFLLSSVYVNVDGWDGKGKLGKEAKAGSFPIVTPADRHTIHIYDIDPSDIIMIQKRYLSDKEVEREKTYILKPLDTEEERVSNNFHDFIFKFYLWSDKEEDIQASIYLNVYSDFPADFFEED